MPRKPHKTPPAWAARLKAAFDAKADSDGWEMTDLAERSGVPYDSVVKYLNGHVEQPRGERLNRLCDALGVELAWVLGFAEGEPLFIDEKPRPDPGPLDERATIRALRLVLSELMGEERLNDVPPAKLRAAAHSASDLWRTLARQGHALDAAFSPTIGSFFLRGKAPARDEVQYAAELAADLYDKLVPLNALKNTG